MDNTRLISQDLYGAQDRINANIRRAFDFVLSRKGMQRPPVTDESRFVGLEFALQFYETVRAPAGQELLSDSSSAERQRGRSDGTSEVENSDFEEGEEQDDDDSYDESESSLDLQGEHFEEFAAATLSYFKRDGFLNAEIADEILQRLGANDEKCLDLFRSFFAKELTRQQLLDELVQIYSQRLLQQNRDAGASQQKPEGRLHSGTTVTFFKDARFNPTKD
eukprot:INCI1483.2.p2 GENE.INCI1483.2~~INCI1483.2.p2  ORF type:complete len:247 (+),score=45.77 INCI1483.2:81-743(+)